MPTKSLLVLTVLALACQAQAADLAGADSPYRLHLADKDQYRLAKPYRAVKPEAVPAVDPVSAAVAAAAHAEMEAKPYARQIDHAAQAANLDPALVQALIYVESRHHAQAVSAKGAVGLMQVLPDTAARYGISNPMRTEQNLKAGTRYLRTLMDQFDNRLDLVLAAYNAGEGAVLSHDYRIPPYRETRDYVKAVLAKYGEWREPAPPLLLASADGAMPMRPYGGHPAELHVVR